jgi:pimeloyl-ACP methyl ester carboxylesterase
VSGPHLALIWASTTRNLKKLSFSGLAAALEQLGSSWYTFALQAPIIPELLLKNFGARMMRDAWQKGGVPADDSYLRVSNTDVWNRTQYGIELYRQNVLAPPPAPARGSLDTPIMLVIPERDPYIRPSSFDTLSDYAPDVERLHLDASHWCPRSHPTELVAAIRNIVARTESRAASTEARS